MYLDAFQRAMDCKALATDSHRAENARRSSYLHCIFLRLLRFFGTRAFGAQRPELRVMETAG